jgi:lysophospholipase L1-like esterase/poly(3-hydroxybutyrate) depolymerase
MNPHRLGTQSLALVALLATAVLPVRAQTEPYEARVFTNAAGATLPYRLHKPAEAQAGGTRLPLVLFLHGAGERGNNNQAQLIHGTGTFVTPQAMEKFPCFVIAPQCPNNQQWVNISWSTESGTRPEISAPMQLALGALDSVIKEFPVDTNRIYVTGLSMGGYGTWDCVTRFPNRFAAGVPICGGGDEKTVTPEVAKVPVWAFHSSDDGVVKVIRTRNMIAAMKDKGGHPHYFEYFGLGHGSWGQAYSEPELLPWLFSQRLGQADTFAVQTKAPEPVAATFFPENTAFPGKGPIRRADWFRNLWLERRVDWYKNRDNDKHAVVFLGDSITQGWGTLAKDFPNLKVANRGISGDFTRGVLYRLKEDVLDLDPQAVVLLIGTNDLEEQGKPEEIAENVKAILAACKAAHPNTPVIVCKVMPSDASKKRPADKIQKINALVDTVVQSDPLFIRCDTYSLFANAEGNAKSEEFPDLLHPNAAGYAKFAAALNPIFEKLKLGK